MGAKLAGNWRDPIGDPVTDPLGPTSGTHRAKRGGSWLNHPYNARSAERRFYYPNEKTHYFGFRVAFKKAEPAQPTTHTVDLNSSVNLEMIWVEPGTFTMGSPVTEEGRRSDETEHNVTITEGFYLGKYEVTQAQYEAVMTGNSEGLSTTPSHFSNNPNRPVERVSWDDAQVFLARLNEQQAGNLPAGWSYVLPTEAQWEYACRAGTTTAYSWGIALLQAMPIMNRTSVIRPMWVSMRPTLGAFSICMEMSLSGPRTGTRRLILPAIR